MINTPTVLNKKQLGQKPEIGQSVRGPSDYDMEGTISRKIPNADAPSWEVIMEDGSTTIMTETFLKPLLIPPHDQLHQAYHFLSNPEALLGKSITKKFEKSWFCGIVTNTDVDSANGDTLWEVSFQDGDICDYNLPDILPLISEFQPTPHTGSLRTLHRHQLTLPNPL